MRRPGERLAGFLMTAPFHVLFGFFPCFTPLGWHCTTTREIDMLRLMADG
ncbi:hypothetical protein [Amycolatopsis regifaucium]|nr:hypothetical protein [Amycolatopsis regifaucium]